MFSTVYFHENNNTHSTENRIILNRNRNQILASIESGFAC